MHTISLTLMFNLMCLSSRQSLSPYSRTDTMAGFHLPGDPYYPNQDSGEGIENDPEEEMQEESDSDPENNNLPLAAPIQNPNLNRNFVARHLYGQPP